jgi:transcriptional regulator
LALLKGTLDLLILKTVSWGPMHGYGISRWLRERSGDAFRIEEGALYPALRRLERKGWLRSEWGETDTGREAKFYRLTSEGQTRLQAEAREWGRYVEAMAQVLHGPRPAWASR